MRTSLMIGAILSLMIATLPPAMACETEVERALNGGFPAPTGISPNKDESIRESVRLANIGQSVAREMLWQVLMGAELSERAIADEIYRAMIENGSNPDWPSFSTIVASGANGAIPHGDPEHDGAGPKQVQVGDVVVVDLGARVTDWVSDVTRSYVVGGTTSLIHSAMDLESVSMNRPYSLAEATTRCLDSRTISNPLHLMTPSPLNRESTWTDGLEYELRTIFWSTRKTMNS